jgi:hypothetical protein
MKVTGRPIDKKDLERYAIFLFGVLFLCVILTLLVAIPKPTLAQFFAFRLTLALAAAGVGAFIPGFMHLEQPLPHRGLIRCGGAMALFAAVWFGNPAKFAIEGISPPPTADAREFLEHFLSVSDKDDMAAAYDMFSQRERSSVSLASFSELVGNVRRPLGNRVKGPILWNTSNPEEIPGRKGPFVFNAYQSTFSGRTGVWVEVVGVIAEDGRWRMHTYTLQPCIAPFCQQLESLN